MPCLRQRESVRPGVGSCKNGTAVAKRQLKTQAQEQLLNRILSSRQFEHAHMLKRVLLYLVERSQRGDSPKEYEIAVHALGRPDSFDARLDPIVRVSVSSIRSRLAAYFATEGRHEPLQLVIPKGQYRLQFTRAGAVEPASVPMALSRFWEPYFSKRAANIIVYTEPLFFSDNRGHFFRSLYTNDPASAPEVQELLSRCGLGSFEPAFHYLSTGEVHCLLSLSRMFHEMGVPVETRSSRVASWNELRQANLILLGSPRTNPFISTLQGDEPFFVASDHIESRLAGSGGQSCYAASRYRDGNLARRTDFAVITRRPALVAGRAVTLIAANHGKAIEGAGHFLTLEDQVSTLLESMGLDADAAVPERFQALMRVEMVDLNDEVVQTVCEQIHVLRSPGGRRLPPINR